MKRVIILIGIITVFIGCKKSSESSPAPTPIPLNPIQLATEFIFEKIGSANSNPNQIQISYKGTVLNIFTVDGNGIYSAEFHGLAGASMLQGAARHPVIGSTNFADWQIGAGDTLRIFKNGTKYIDYIGDQSDGINGGIFVSVNPGENETLVKTRINNFTNTAGDLKTLKFKQH